MKSASTTTAWGLNGAAEVGRARPGRSGSHRGHGFLDRHVRDAIEHHAHGALVAVLADEHHGAAGSWGRPAAGPATRRWPRREVTSGISPARDFPWGELRLAADPDPKTLRSASRSPGTRTRGGGVAGPEQDPGQASGRLVEVETGRDLPGDRELAVLASLPLTGIFAE